MKLRRCPSCSGFVPRGVDVCVHCEAKVPAPVIANRFMRSLAKASLTIAGGGALAATLMACYGVPPCDESVDQDGDGYSICLSGGGYGQDDCDDTNADTYPGAEDELGDGIDQNCDGVDGVAGDGGVIDDAGVTLADDTADAGA